MYAGVHGLRHAHISQSTLHFNGHFSRWTWISRYQNIFIPDFIGAKSDGSGGDNYSCKTCKAPVKSSPTNQHPASYRPDALPVAQPAVSKHWRKIMPTRKAEFFSQHISNCGQLPFTDVIWLTGEEESSALTTEPRLLRWATINSP